MPILPCADFPASILILTPRLRLRTGPQAQVEALSHPGQATFGAR
ncbi:hypothetical protein [Pseudoruegeria sp. SK021]|nr:hypothetical protein [Pseudoruegeria sp. SK021]